MLLDLGLVTSSLLALIREHVDSSPLATKLNTLSPTAQPPDKLSGSQTVSLYLYHLAEDPHCKNLPSAGLDDPPVRFTPMALKLYYVLTAFSQQTGSAGTELEQSIMGAAVKALRDYPVIDDSTEIGGVKILHADLQGRANRFRIVLQSLQPNEAMQYWNSGSQPLRLAAWYEVSVVLLEPPEARSKSGRVLIYGVHTFLRGSPRLDGSRSRVTFTIPGEATPRTVEARPAEAATGQVIEFTGSDLAGEETKLLVKDERLKDFIDTGASWGISTNGSVLYAAIQPLIGTEPTLPGVYSAMVQVTNRKRMPDGTLRDFVSVSNVTPFLIAPTITNVSAPAPVTNEVDITGSIFQHADLDASQVALYVGAARLLPRKPPAGLGPGEFDVINPTLIRFRFPILGVAPGQTLPLRLIIRGAENEPRWIQTV